MKTLLILGIYFLHAATAQAECVPGTENACGHPKICISADPNAKTGRKDDNKCLPDKVCGALKILANKFGRVEIASAKRVNNKSRGGVTNSWHKTCKAADFLIPNYKNRAQQMKLAQEMKRINAIGRNVYCTGRAHVSISPRENFYNSCVAGNPNKRMARKHR